MALTTRLRKARWLYLPVEVATRELASRLLLACCAAERGYHAVIGKKRDLGNLYWGMPRGMIVDKSLAVVREKQFARLRELGFRLSASEEESIWAYREPDQFVRMRVSSENVAVADHYFTWGQKQADIICEREPSAARIIVNTGTPRIDILKKEFHGLFRREVESILSRYGRFIMLPSNFSMVLDSRGGRENYAAMRQRHRGVEAEEDTTYLDEFLDHFQTNLDAFVAALPRIKAAFPDHTLLVRPHPGDSHSFWKDACRDIPGCEAIYEGAVIPWLIAAEATFHHGCTTGLESYFLGGSAIAYHPTFDERYDNHMSTWLGPVATDEAELIDFLKIAVSGNSLPRESTAWLDEYFCLDSDRYASDRIVDAVDAVPFADERLGSMEGVLRRVALRGRSMLKDSKRASTHGASGDDYREGRSDEWSRVDPAAISEMIDVFREGAGRFDAVSVEPLDDNVFLVRR